MRNSVGTQVKTHRLSSQDAEWKIVHQTVGLSKYRQEIIKLAHESSFAGRLGFRKALDKS